LNGIDAASSSVPSIFSARASVAAPSLLDGPLTVEREAPAALEARGGFLAGFLEEDLVDDGFLVAMGGSEVESSTNSAART
jgi:hypothetical protein